LNNTKRDYNNTLFRFILQPFRLRMKKKVLEQLIVILLFILVLVVFSFAERDSRKLDRLYKTAQLVQKKVSTHTTQAPPASANNITP
jgi:hypothetical protein